MSAFDPELPFACAQSGRFELLKADVYQFGRALPQADMSLPNSGHPIAASGLLVREKRLFDELGLAKTTRVSEHEGDDRS